MRLPKDYAAPRQEETAVEYIWEQKGCVQQRREPIVRCRDCIYYKQDPDQIDPGWPMMCESTGQDMLEPYGFCAWGARKADA